MSIYNSSRVLLAVLLILFLIGVVSGDIAGFNASVDGYAYRTADNMTVGQAAGGAGTGVNTVGTSAYMQIATYPGTQNNLFHIGTKIVWSADTSGIPDNAEITDARFNYTIFRNFTSMKPFSITLTNGTTTTDGAIVSGDYTRNGSVELIDTRVLWSDPNAASGSTQRSLILNSAGRSAINKTGYTTLFFQISDTHDSAFSGTWATDPAVGANNTIYIYSNDYSTNPAYRPVLNITYYIPTPPPEPEFPDWAWCGEQDIFLRNDTSDITGYFVMDHRPQINDTKYLATTVSSGTGSKRIGSWATTPGSPGVSVIGPGLWRFRVYLNVSSAVGNTNYEFKIFNRSSSGTETDLFYGHVISKDINDLTPTEHLISYARRNYTTLFSGDRLVIKVNASTSSVAARDAWISLAGNTQASMVESGYYLCPDELGMEQSAIIAESPASPGVAILALAVVAIAAVMLRKGRGGG